MKKISTLLIFIIYFNCCNNVMADSIIESINFQHPDTLIGKVDCASNNDISLKRDTIEIKVVEKVIVETTQKDLLNLILPILTLFLGFFLNRGYEYLLRKRKIKEEGERWVVELKSLEPLLSSQKDLVNDFIDTHINQNHSTKKILIHDVLKCQVFDSLDKPAYFKYLKTKEKDLEKVVELSNDTYWIISSSQSTITLLIKSLDEYKINHSRYNEIFRNNLQALKQSFLSYGIKLSIELGDKYEEDVLYRQLFTIFKEQLLSIKEAEQMNPLILEETFIKPLSVILTDNFQSEIMMQMTPLISNCNMQIQNIKDESGSLIRNYKRAVGYFESLQYKLDEFLTNTFKY